ncbi:hypothetical protein PJI16_00940 [Nitrospira sp. MA-1]|nr:hypothetical protein [Nitrospira sp. MA-1]
MVTTDFVAEGRGATIVFFTTEAFFFLRGDRFGAAGFLAVGVETAFTTFLFVGVRVLVFFTTGFFGVPVFFAETLLEEANLAFVGDFLAPTGFFAEGPLEGVFFFPNAVPVLAGFFVTADLEARVFFLVTDGFFEEGFEATRRTDFF